jgi:hypothetical protein
MKAIIPLLLMIGICSGYAQTTATAAAKPPTEVKLTSGSMLRRIEVVRFESERVVLKHMGGVDTINYKYIAEPYRGQLLAYRDEWQQSHAKQSAQASQPRTVTGQVYIVTRGRENHTLGDLTVRFVPKVDMEYFLSSNSIDSEYEKRLNTRGYNMDGRPYDSGADAIIFEHFDNAPTADIQTKTDADGRFSIQLPKGTEYYALARDTRRVVGKTEFYVFLRLIGEGETTANLSNGDLWSPGKK